MAFESNSVISFQRLLKICCYEEEAREVFCKNFFGIMLHPSTFMLANMYITQSACGGYTNFRG